MFCVTLKYVDLNKYGLNKYGRWEVKIESFFILRFRHLLVSLTSVKSEGKLWRTINLGMHDTL